jgi:rRNA maturation endonuclease Nob1
LDAGPMIPKCDLINHRAIAGCERQFQYCPYCGCNLAIVRSKADR